MATENPGRFVGNRGLLRPGAKADLLGFTLDPGKQALETQMVLVGGIEWP
jgi:cytosine/adenosine deaminase-related metal-dependent hydrolase